MPRHDRPDYWQPACRALSRADPVMARLIRAYPDAALRSRGNAFETLLRAIVGQQISVKAADAVWARVCAATPLQPGPVAALGIDGLRACGLSRMKAEYAIDLAEHFSEGRIKPRRWAHMEDEAVIAELADVRGIGRWTAEMFLIFHLLRPNVWPVGDLGLLKAISLHYRQGEKVGAKEARAIGEAWQPWRTVATWYLWRSLDPVAVEY
ncbi:MAG: DNA-3-methyladenine glycosylase 2 family protein [Pseudomonadota bacterium]